ALLQRYIGDVEPQRVHDQTLEPFIKARLAAGASATTINRSLEVLRTILNRAARSYRDPDGRAWLETLPPLITMLAENPRSPYPLTWKEQDELFRRLPTHLARMALFAINTGLRQSNLCGLQWTWEVPVPEVGRSVFVIPPEAFKTKRPHVVILNDVAWSIIDTQRGKHPIWVFPYRGRRIGKMNNNGWQQARYEVGLTQVRVHDLRHSFACRLRAAGVSAEDREALLGHANHSMAGHYANGDGGPPPETSEPHSQPEPHTDRATRGRRLRNNRYPCVRTHRGVVGTFDTARCIVEDEQGLHARSRYALVGAFTNTPMNIRMFL